jgi:carbon monoxide dehydrogenase subunit G
MDMTGEYRIPAPRERVWAALNDPEVLRQAIPGCESVTKTSENEMEAAVTAAVGPVKARFKGKVTLSDIVPPESYTITGEGTGGAAGFAKGSAHVSLREDGADTLMSYTVKATVGGKLAQIGSRLIDGTAKKMADEFFTRFVALAAAPAPSVEATEPVIEAAPAPTSGDAPTTPVSIAQPSPGIPSWVWIAGLVVAALLALYFIQR